MHTIIMHSSSTLCHSSMDKQVMITQTVYLKQSPAYVFQHLYNGIIVRRLGQVGNGWMVCCVNPKNS